VRGELKKFLFFFPSYVEFSEVCVCVCVCVCVRERERERERNHRRHRCNKGARETTCRDFTGLKLGKAT